MRLTRALAASILLSVCLGPAASARSSVEILLGFESLNRNMWEGVADPIDIGVAATVGLGASRYVIEFGGLLLSDSVSGFSPFGGESQSYDMLALDLFAGLGVRIPFGKKDETYFSVTGGASYTSARLKIDFWGLPADSTDETMGFYFVAGGGLRSDRFDISLRFRYRLQTALTLNDVKGDINGVAVLFSVGRSF